MDLFIYNLLCKRGRRRRILLNWHSSKCMDGNDVTTVFYNFSCTILYDPLRVSFHREYLRLFETTTLLKVPYSWLQELDEREFLKQASGRYQPEWKIEHRRELLRDFMLMTMTHKEWGDYCRTYVWVAVCQRMMGEKRVDRFVKEMHNALQGDNDVDKVLCWYP